MYSYDDFRPGILQLRYWHIEQKMDGRMIAYGLVYGHRKFTDGTLIRTSEIKHIFTDLRIGMVTVVTQNSRYRCSAMYCEYFEQDQYPDLIPDYEELKKRAEAREKELDIAAESESYTDRLP